MPQPPGQVRRVPRPRFVVERYEPGLTFPQLKASEPEVRRAAAALTSDGHPVRYLGALLIPAEETAFVVFEADAAHWVAEASRMADLPFDRIALVVELRESERLTSAAVRMRHARVDTPDPVERAAAPKEVR